MSDEEQDLAKIEDYADDLEVTSSADALVSFIFTQPYSANTAKELYGGKVVKFLIGFQNRGEKDFIVKHSETSFRYPMDFSYNLQNFTFGQYNRRVAPKDEVTLDYAFFAHESFAGRPLGLVVDLHYEDSEGHYVTNVFNETVTILEDDSGFNTETGFMYLIFAAFLAALFLVGYHFINKFTRKAGMQKKRQPVVEQGTTNSEVDFEWIPREILKHNEKKSPKPSSPRNNGKTKKTN